jgi:hypothetical protein
MLELHKKFAPPGVWNIIAKETIARKWKTNYTIHKYERDRDGSGVGERVRKQNSAVEAIQNISASEVSVVEVW